MCFKKMLKNKKKILFVIESLNCGGAEKSLVTLLNNIDNRTYAIDLLLIKKGGEFEKFVPRGVEVIYKDILVNTSFLSLLFKRISFRIFRKSNWFNSYHSSQLFWKVFGKGILEHEKEYDVAIAYGQGFPTYFVSEKTTCNYKYTWLNTDYRETGYNPTFDFKYYQRFNKIIAVSEQSKNSLQTSMQSIGRTVPINIIKDISDKEFIVKRSLEEILPPIKNDTRKVNILTVCRLEKVKGLDLAVEACKILIDKGISVKWSIIGEGSERFFLEQKIKEYSLDNKFVLLGFKENPYPYMKNCDIYVQSSLFEGLGLTVIEAAILCKPIVTTNFPTASTIVSHKKTGLICEMSANSIAEHVQMYVKNEELVKEITKNLSNVQNDDKQTSLKAFNQLIL